MVGGSKWTCGSSGHGSASTDRVMRFVPEFATPAAASQYALDEGMLWVERQAPDASHKARALIIDYYNTNDFFQQR